MMVRDECFIDLPEIDWEAVQRTLRERVFAAYLEYRTAIDEFDAFLGAEKPMWQLRCSGCGETYCIEKARDFHVSKLDRCPRCGRLARPIRWRNREKEYERALVKILLRGEGRTVWMRCWRLKLVIDGGGALIEGYECARYRYDDGGARKWKSVWSFHTGETAWSEQKRFGHENWKRNNYQISIAAPEVYFFGYTLADVEEPPDFGGTCIEYSAFEQFLRYRNELECAVGLIEDYLALYCKYPIVEYLVKGGFECWIEDYLKGYDRLEFRKVVNLRAKKPKKLLKELTMREAALLKRRIIPIAARYEELKREGAIGAPSEEAVEYARMVAENPHRYEYVLRGSGGDGKKLRRYLERQAEKGNVSLSVAMGDYRDYLQENMDDLGLAPGTFDAFPGDLLAAHARLTSRLKRKEKSELRPEFRMRRRRLRPVRWEHGGLFIRPVDSPLEMVREGEQQEHCVAGYQSGHAKGGSYILLLRDREAPKAPLYTVEWNAKENRVIQCRGWRNRPLHPETEERKNKFLEAWVARNERLRAEGKLKDVI